MGNGPLPLRLLLCFEDYGSRDQSESSSRDSFEIDEENMLRDQISSNLWALRKLEYFLSVTPHNRRALRVEFASE